MHEFLVHNYIIIRSAAGMAIQIKPHRWQSCSTAQCLWSDQAALTGARSR